MSDFKPHCQALERISIACALSWSGRRVVFQQESFRVDLRKRFFTHYSRRSDEKVDLLSGRKERVFQSRSEPLTC